MKKTPFTQPIYSIMLLVTILLAGPYSIHAQIVVPPTKLDQYIGATIPVTVLNNALMRYTCNGGGDLMGSTYYNSSTAILKGYFVLNDGVGGVINTTITAPAHYRVLGNIDIMIGGHPAPYNPNYYVGVVYTARDSVTTATDVFLNVYKVSNPGSPLFTITNRCTGIKISNTGDAHAAPHIDGILKDDGAGGYIYDNFAIVWQNDSKIYGYYGKGLMSIINGGKCSPSFSITSIVNDSSTSGIIGEWPDVAAIERTVGGAIHDIALLTYKSLYSDAVYYQEWDMTTNTPSGITTALTSSNGFRIPRIDAIDYHTINDPSNGYANYNIVCGLSGIGENYYAYNNLSNYNCAFGTFLDSLGGNVSVAYGPVSEDAVYTTIANTGWTGLPFNNYSQTIDRSTGLLSNTNMLQVNTGAGSVDYAIASNVDTPMPNKIFVSWLDFNTGKINYKLSGAPVSYKSTAVNNVTNKLQFSLSPNPAKDMITLSINGADINGDNYTITDLTGRIMRHDVIQNKKQTIDINMLPKGMYLLTYYSTDKDIKTIKFVKD